MRSKTHFSQCINPGGAITLQICCPIEGTRVTVGPTSIARVLLSVGAAENTREKTFVLMKSMTLLILRKCSSYDY